MTDNDEVLIGFVSARLDDDEWAANAANALNPVPWENMGGHVRGRVVHEPPGLRNDHIDGGLWDNEGARSLSMHDDTAEHVARHNPARVIVDVWAKRAVVEAYRDVARHDRDDVSEPVPGRARGLGFAVRALAGVWASHPGYRPEWGA